MRWVGTLPQNIVAGAVEALHDNSHIDRLYLVGDKARIEGELRKLGVSDNRIEIVHASEVIEMDDPPVQAVRRKKDSSMNRAIDLVKRGDADAIVSAGNTGALLTASQVKLRTLDGVDRAGLAVTTARAPKRVCADGCGRQPRTRSFQSRPVRHHGQHVFKANSRLRTAAGGRFCPSAPRTSRETS